MVNAMLNASYRYPSSNDIFKVSEIRKFVIIFECGHWCTDCIFEDMILVKGIQLNLF